MLQLLIAVIALVLHSCNANEIVAINLIGQYPFRPNDQVFVRGDNCGLSWDRGSQMQCNGSSATIILQCPPSTQISIKLLLNDQVWMRGANAVFDSSSGGGTIEVFPWFYTNEGRYRSICLRSSTRHYGLRHDLSFVTHSKQIRSFFFVLFAGTEQYSKRRSIFPSFIFRKSEKSEFYIQTKIRVTRWTDKLRSPHNARWSKPVQCIDFFSWHSMGLSGWQNRAEL